MKPRQIQREMRRRGWELVRVKGDHFVYQHPNYAGSITVTPFSMDQDYRAGARWRSLMRKLDAIESGSHVALR